MTRRTGYARRIGSVEIAIFALELALLLIVLVTSTFASTATTTAASASAPPSQPAVKIATGQDWPTYLGNINRTSNSSGEKWLSPRNADQLGVNWTFTAGATLPNGSAAVSNAIVSSTTIVKGTAYLGSWNGYEYALNVTTHATEWSTYLGVDSFDPKCGNHPSTGGTNEIGISSAPTVFNGVLYLGGNNATGGEDAAFYALNASTGKILWSVPTGNMSDGYYSWASPLIYDGYVYVGIASNCDQPLVQAGLDQINLQTNLTTTTHLVVHRFNTMPTVSGKEVIGASIWSSPSVDPENNTIFVTTGNPVSKTQVGPGNYSESVIALNATTLQLESYWQVPRSEVVGDGDFGADAMVVHDVTVGGKPETLVVAGNKDGYVYAWNASDVSRGPLWTVEMDHMKAQIITPAAYGGGLIYVDTPELTIDGVTAAGGIYAIDPNNGTVAWDRALPGRGIGAPLYTNGVVVAAAGEYIEVFNATTGTLYTAFNASGYFVSAPSIAEGSLWVGSEDGSEYVLSVLSHAYTATFTESGLPSETPWSVTLTPASRLSTTLSSTTAAIEFSAPNGTYTYSIAPISGYHITTGSYTGSLTVDGANPANISVHWTQVKYTVKFVESGLASGTEWSVKIDGKTKSSTGTSISFSLPNGTFSFTITATGYSETSNPSSPLTVDGTKVKVAVTFTL